jgi:hypothetical protein
VDEIPLGGCTPQEVDAPRKQLTQALKVLRAAATDDDADDALADIECIVPDWNQDPEPTI